MSMDDYPIAYPPNAYAKHISQPSERNTNAYLPT